MQFIRSIQFGMDVCMGIAIFGDSALTPYTLTHAAVAFVPFWDQ